MEQISAVIAGWRSYNATAEAEISWDEWKEMRPNTLATRQKRTKVNLSVLAAFMDKRIRFTNGRS